MRKNKKPAQKSASKSAQKTVYELGDIYIIGEEYCVVKFINCGKAWLAPAETCIERGRYSHCADRQLDEYGNDVSGKHCTFVGRPASEPQSLAV